MNYTRLRNFILGFAHANSAPPHFALKDIDLESEHITSDLSPDEMEEEMMGINDTDEFWYHMGRIADEGYTLTGPEGEQLKCFKYLDETL